MSQPGGFDAEACCWDTSAGELTPQEERMLLEAAARDQDPVRPADGSRSGAARPEFSGRTAAGGRGVAGVGTAGALGRRQSPACGSTCRFPGRRICAPRGTAARHRALWIDLLRSVMSTVATTLSLRLCYAVITAIGSSLVLPQIQPARPARPVVPPVPSILHLVHAAIAALLLAIQFTPSSSRKGSRERITRSRASVWHSSSRAGDGRGSPGWRLYCWLWVHAGAGGRPDAVADMLNCLTSFPLFWCFFVLDKPSVAVPGDPARNASFRKAIGTCGESAAESRCWRWPGGCTCGA